MRAAVLALVWGSPVRVLLVRKSCRGNSRWACDLALPGGRVEEGEDPVETALREAWEEACVPPRGVRVLGVFGVEYTRRGRIPIVPVLAVPRGPLCPRPCDSEVDAVIWAPLSVVAREPRLVLHPRMRVLVEGYPLAGGVLWGATLRILQRLQGVLEEVAGSTMRQV